jgi:hypothetical protein
MAYASLKWQNPRRTRTNRSNLTVQDEQRNKLEQMASLENRSVSILSRLWPMNAGAIG